MATQNLKRALFALLILALANCSSRRGNELEFDPIDDDDDDVVTQDSYTCTASILNEDLTSPAAANNKIQPLTINVQVSTKKNGVSFSSRVVAVARDGAQLLTAIPTASDSIHQLSLKVDREDSYFFRFGIAKPGSSTVIAACSVTADVEAAGEEVPDVLPTVRLLSENGRTFEDVPYGSSLYMGWYATGVEECVITANDVPLRDMLGQIVKVTSGVFSTGVLTIPSVVYKATCTAPQGVTSPAPAIVGVSVRPLPAVQLLINGSPTPAQLAAGGATIPVTWNSTDAVACSLKANDVELNPSYVSFGTKQVPVTVTTLFELECKDGAIPPHRIRREIEIKVAAPLVPTVTLAVQARSVAPGAATNLNWTSKDISTCSLKRGKPDSSDLVEISTLKSATNFSSGAINGPTRFKLSCSGLGGQKNAEVVVGLYVPGNIRETYLPQNMCANGDRHCGGGNYPGHRDSQPATAPLLSNLWPGMKLTYNSMNGISIYRVHRGNASSYACPQGIAVQFKDAYGNVVPVAGYSYGLVPVAQLANGYEIPPNAVSVWGSFPDSAYEDNGGRRDHHSYTHGCHFVLETYQ